MEVDLLMKEETSEKDFHSLCGNDFLFSRGPFMLGVPLRKGLTDCTVVSKGRPSPDLN